jgi:drug/metabolite transporter (DMT)-like permease
MSQPGSYPSWRADLALVAVTLIWGTTFVLVKEALRDVSTLLFLTLRFSLAALALAVAFRGRHGGFFWRAGALKSGFVAGLCLFTGYLFQTFGLRYTTASKSAFITGSSIVLVPLLSSAVYRTVPHASEWLGVAVATVGMALLTLQGETLGIGFGDLLTLFCAAGFACHIVVVGHYSRRVGFESLSVVQIATAAVISLSVFWWVEPPHIRWGPSMLLALGVTGLLATAVAFTVQAWAQKHTTATHTALIFALEPVFAWVTSFLVAGETLSRWAGLGASLILCGIILVELKPIPLRRRVPG